MNEENEAEGAQGARSPDDRLAWLDHAHEKAAARALELEADLRESCVLLTEAYEVLHADGYPRFHRWIVDRIRAFLRERSDRERSSPTGSRPERCPTCGNTWADCGRRGPPCVSEPT